MGAIAAVVAVAFVIVLVVSVVRFAFNSPCPYCKVMVKPRSSVRRHCGGDLTRAPGHENRLNPFALMQNIRRGHYELARTI